MKVSSIAETDRGGAGLSALKLHLELSRLGVESRLYVNRKTSDRAGVERIPNRPGNKKSAFALGQYTPRGSPLAFTSGLSVKDEAFLDSVYRASDVVLLRWSSVAISDFTISRWAHGPKPVVWCLSDMAPFTGGCHYSSDCHRYETSCHPCPFIPGDELQIPSIVLRRRKALWRNITFVSPSNWLATCLENSALAPVNDIRVIRTGVELDVFKPRDASDLAKEHGIDTSKPLLLFGAHSCEDPRKGFRYLREAIGILNEQLGTRGRYGVVVAGHGSSDLESLDAEVHQLGHVSSRDIMAKVYSLADLTVLPYVEDNLPNVCLESLACGTPVVAFRIGGFPDVIEPGLNGELVQPFDTWDLAHRIKRVLSSRLCTDRIRQHAEKEIDVTTQAKAYIELFRSLTEEARHRRNHG